MGFVALWIGIAVFFLQAVILSIISPLVQPSSQAWESGVVETPNLTPYLALTAIPVLLLVFTAVGIFRSRRWGFGLAIVLHLPLLMTLPSAVYGGFVVLYSVLRLCGKLGQAAG